MSAELQEDYSKDLIKDQMKLLFQLRAKMMDVAHKATHTQGGSIMSPSQKETSDSYHARAVNWLNDVGRQLVRQIDSAP